MAVLDPVRAVGDVVEVPRGGEEGAVARLGNLCFEKLFYAYFIFLLGKLCVSHLGDFRLPVVLPSHPHVDDGVVLYLVLVVKHFLPHCRLAEKNKYC